MAQKGTFVRIKILKNVVMAVCDFLTGRHSCLSGFSLTAISNLDWEED